MTALLNGTRKITARTPLLLSSHFGNTAEFWMNVQTAHNLEVARADLATAA